jgi:hypothetical protein
MTPIYVFPNDGELTKLRETTRRKITIEYRRQAMIAAELEGIRTVVWLRRDIDRRIDRNLAGIRDDRRVNGYVYVAGSPDGGLIKIGSSRRPRLRVRALRLEMKLQTIALFYIQGEIYLTSTEYEVHRLLWAHNRGRELFDVSPEMAITAVKTAGKTAAKDTFLLRDKPMYLDFRDSGQENQLGAQRAADASGSNHPADD